MSTDLLYQRVFRSDASGNVVFLNKIERIILSRWICHFVLFGVFENLVQLES